MSRQNHSRFRIYLSLELKKYRLAFPKICGGLCLILLLTGCYLLLYQLYASEQQKQNKIHIGITADPDEPYLDWMIQTIQSMKDLKYSCQFELVSEEEGMRHLQAGKYTALFLIPHDYIHSLIDGDEAVLRIRFCQGHAGVADYLIRELGNTASQIMLDTQAGIYAMQDYYRENHWPDMTKDELSLNIRYLQKILNRKEIYSYEEIPATGTLADQTHYFAAAILCLLTSLGFTCTTVLRREPEPFLQKLQQSGFHDWQRILAKLAAMVICFGCIYLFLSLLCTAVSPWIPGFNSILQYNADSALPPVIQTGIKLSALLPVLFVICTYILWIYEVTQNPVSSILLLFISFLCLGYLSGYFYPLSYLPDSIQRLSACLPTGVILNYSYHIFTGKNCTKDLLGIAAYSILLYGTLIGAIHSKKHVSGKFIGYLH